MSNYLKVSDIIANFLKEKQIKEIFGIIGSANSHIFDSIKRLNYTNIICVHHEQAATMAMQTYYRINKKMTVALVTAGAGSSNAITGVMSAWADSIPGLIISGQENSRFIKSMKNMRMWGIQGFDSTLMVNKITKYSKRILKPESTLFELEKSFTLCASERPGPVWLDFPIDIQGTVVNKKNLFFFDKPRIKKKKIFPLKKIRDLILKSKRPVFWLGHGIRLSSLNATEEVKKLLKMYPFPTLLTWAGLDMLESLHPLNFGSPGVYGNRHSNLILQNSDLIISIGNRMSISMIGYEHSEFAREAKLIHVDIDNSELKKLDDKKKLSIISDASLFIKFLIRMRKKIFVNNKSTKKWFERCKKYKQDFPKIELEAHKDSNGFINSYRFIDKLCDYLKSGNVVTTDMGTALLSGHQAFKIKKNQRLMTSTGLGEMGMGLPAAIGASFASNKGQVYNLNCDGGMLINLQELQTIVHHKLPIKIFIFNNDGYLMIKHTQKSLFNGRYVGTTKNTGLSFPDYNKIARGFSLKYFSISKWKDFYTLMPKIIKFKKALICEVFMDPEQNFYPKLSLAITPDNKIVSPPLEDLSPLLKRDILKKEMIVKLHPKSLLIK